MQDKDLAEIKNKLTQAMVLIKKEIAEVDDTELKAKLVRMTDYVNHLSTISLKSVDDSIANYRELRREIDYGDSND